MNQRFLISDTPIRGLKTVRRLPMEDERGYLERLFCSDELRAAGWVDPVMQVNHTYSLHAGTVRGMHFQHPPFDEHKLVACLRGEVWDVAVDLRPDSPTHLAWHAEKLSAGNRLAMLIPPGCAHGFQTLEDHVEMLYCHSRVYSPTAEDGINPLDSTLAIPWPLPPNHISTRDAGLAHVRDSRLKHKP